MERLREALGGVALHSAQPEQSEERVRREPAQRALAAEVLHQGLHLGLGLGPRERHVERGPAEVAVAWVFAIVTFGYMLPWAVAATRGKSNSGAIALLNFLLGWTFIGWVAALVLACTAHQVAAVRAP